MDRSHVRRAPPTVLFIGTSLTAGDGLTPDQAFPKLIENLADSAHVPIVSVNAGVSGETSDEALQRIDDLMRTPADIVVLETGANDGFREVPVSQIKTNIEAIIDHVRRTRPDTRIALIRMAIPPTGDLTYFKAFVGMYPEIATEKSVTLFPFLLRAVVGHPELNQEDGIHPNATGERLVARTVWEALEPLVRTYYKPSQPRK